MNKAMIQNKELEISSLKDIKTFGFWVYLMSDLVLFSILFSAFAVLGRSYAGGPTPKELFSIPYLFGETSFLLVSSVLMGMSMIAVLNDKKKLAITGLIFTVLTGWGFVAMEINEFAGMIANGAGPSHSAFLSSFFTLVGTHGFHVSMGSIWIVTMIVQISVSGLTKGIKSRLYRLSMFWHFLDIVWIGVFTIVYLMGLV